MIEAYRLVLPDGFCGFWHPDGPYVDLLVAMSAYAPGIVLESQTFPDEDALEYANDQRPS